jgi:hypothetical protein
VNFVYQIENALCERESEAPPPKSRVIHDISGMKKRIVFNFCCCCCCVYMFKCVCNDDDDDAERESEKEQEMR